MDMNKIYNLISHMYSIEEDPHTKEVLVKILQTIFDHSKKENEQWEDLHG